MEILFLIYESIQFFKFKELIKHSFTTIAYEFIS